MSIKEAYEKKLQAELDQMSAEIDQLKAKADLAEADAQLDYYKEIDELRSMQKRAQTKLNELKETSGDAWEDLKAGMEGAWGSISEAVKTARSRFK